MVLSHSDLVNPLGKKILKDVSRSFYLSIQLLPQAMREPVSLGYLLARASDTIADTAELEASLRAEMLEGFQAILEGGEREPWLDRLAIEVIPNQQHEGEQKLLENMDGVFRWLGSLLRGSSADKGRECDQGVGVRQHAAIMTLMRHILRGQRLDIERFELRDDFVFTRDEELEDYCYLVAGCVGEFWTEIGFISREDFALCDKSRMDHWGANYGKGLQLINILRDLPNDLQSGRRYLPGIESGDLESLMQEAKRWRARAREYLSDGCAYSDALVQRRTKLGTSLPGLIGGKTLDLLDKADWNTLEMGVKISRQEVYLSVWEAFWD